jgi:YD repeat-containing protein
MKTLRILNATILILTIAGTFNGCKKSNDKKPACRIIAVATTPTGSAYDLSYNGDGKLSRVTLGNNVTIFEYAATTTIVTTLDSGVFISKTTVRENADGLATNVRREYDVAGTNWTNDVYEYNGVELARSTSTSATSDSASIGTYRWSNGNMVAAISGTTITTLDYYTDRSRQKGDYLYLAQSLQGFEVYRNKNMLKSLSTSRFSYDFDADGKVTSVIINSGGSTSFLDYRYQCN